MVFCPRCYFYEENDMKLCKKITDGISKLAEIVCMVMIAALVVVIVTELVRRNFFNQSYRGTIEVCGICFLWMAFIGIIPLYHDSGLMRLDFLVTRTHGTTRQVIYFIEKIVSLMLGIVMIVAFVAQYPYVSTRTYSTFTLKVPYTIQYVPMAIAGAYMALKSAEQLVERILQLTGKLPYEEGGKQA
jgi:TRAP-type C4-dicarboxylate transport system permease small subunit